MKRGRLPRGLRRAWNLLRGGEAASPPRYRLRCGQAAELINLSRLWPVTLALAVLEVYFLLSDMSAAAGDTGLRLRYLYPDLSLLPVLALLFVFCLLFRARRRQDVKAIHRVVVRAFALVLLLWTAVVAGAEQHESGEISTYVIGLLAVSVLLYAGGTFFTLMFAAGLVTLLATAWTFGIPPGRFLAAHPSLAGLHVIGWLISRLLLRAHRQQFSTRMRLLGARRRQQEANARLRRVNRKLKATQLQLIRQDRLAAIGQLSAGVAHEINNPLAFLKANFSALRQHFQALVRNAATAGGPPGDGLQDLEGLFRDSEEGFQRVIRVVRHLLDFSRVQSYGSLEKYDLHAGIESTLVVARSQYLEVAEIVREYGTLPLIECRGGEINQVLLNILTNAAQALREGARPNGWIRIRTWVDGDRVACAISNNGPPIPADILPRVFAPFFTTKPRGQGTGIGLSIAYDIVVKRHGGELTVTSNGTTTFTLVLPVSGPGAI